MVHAEFCAASTSPSGENVYRVISLRRNVFVVVAFVGEAVVLLAVPTIESVAIVWWQYVRLVAEPTFDLNW